MMLLVELIQQQLNHRLRHPKKFLENYILKKFKQRTKMLSFEPETSIFSFFNTRKKWPGFSYRVIRVERNGSILDGAISDGEGNIKPRDFNVTSASCKCMALVHCFKLLKTPADVPSLKTTFVGGR